MWRLNHGAQLESPLMVLVVVSSFLVSVGRLGLFLTSGSVREAGSKNP